MTVCRPYVVGIGLWLATAMAASEQARAQSWNLYDNSATTYQVSFHGGAMGPNQAGTINILLPGGTIDASKIAPVTMDTGSTGIVVGKDHVDITGRTALGTGSQAYGSSGVSHTGTYYNATVEIYSASPTSGAPPVATAISSQAAFFNTRLNIFKTPQGALSSFMRALRSPSIHSSTFMNRSVHTVCGQA